MMECPLPQTEQGPVLLVVDDRLENLLMICCASAKRR